MITLYGQPTDDTPLGTETDRIIGTVRYGAKGFIVASGGTVQLFGWKSGPSWTRLSQTAVAGATTLQLKDAVSWRVGDRVTIASTDYSQVTIHLQTAAPHRCTLDFLLI